MPGRISGKVTKQGITERIAPSVPAHLQFTVDGFDRRRIDLTSREKPHPAQASAAPRQAGKEKTTEPK